MATNHARFKENIRREGSAMAKIKKEKNDVVISFIDFCCLWL
jgi:hypothetical protein